MNKGAMILTRPDQTRPDQYYGLLTSKYSSKIYSAQSSVECARS